VVLTRRLAVAFLFFAGAHFLPAQSTFGSFVGSVLDPGGAVVPDAVVVAKNLSTAARRSTLSDSTGTFTLVNVEPGTYEISVEAKGFSRALFTNLVLESRQTMRVNASLTLASQSEVVSVEASATTVITTDTSAISNTKPGKELLDLRNFHRRYLLREDVKSDQCKGRKERNEGNGNDSQ